MPLITHDKIISDRGSRYAVSGGPIHAEAEIATALAELTRTKRFARATHNSWAARIGCGGLKNDDGEAGAGAIILRMMEADGLDDHLIVVTRWYGGRQLGGDRFRHVISAVRFYIERWRVSGGDVSGDGRATAPDHPR